MGEFLKNQIWPILVTLGLSAIFQFWILEWVQGQVAYLSMPPLWIDYFYDESLREAAISVKNVDAQKRSFNDLILQLKFSEVVRIDSLRACYNALMVPISADSVKSFNKKDCFLRIRQALHPDDFFLLKARMQGAVYHIESVVSPEVIVRGTGVSVAYSKQDQILKNYSTYFRIGGWIVLTLIFVSGAFWFEFLRYKRKCEFQALRLEELEGSDGAGATEDEASGRNSQRGKSKRKK